MQPCNHEEADARSYLHLKYASSKGHKKAFLRTNDTDWVVNASYIYPKLPELDELWIGYGTGKTYRDIPIHHSSTMLGEQRCKALPLFHDLTGGDHSSALFDRGKNQGFTARDKMGDELTETLISIQNDPNAFTIDSDMMKVLERFFILQYDIKSTCLSLNEARKEMFIMQLKPLESIPPSKHAAYQHAKRSVLHAHEVLQCLNKQIEYLPTEEF